MPDSRSSSSAERNSGLTHSRRPPPTQPPTGAAIASIVAMPGSVGVGASGAIFGLFATSVLLRVTRGFSLKSALEGLVLGQFVVRQVRT